MAHKINVLLAIAMFLTLILLVAVGYRGWKEEYAWHHGHTGGTALTIADITVNLGGLPVREHCQTCHPGGRSAALPGHRTPSTDHPDIAPHSIYDLGCTACHLGEGMAADLKISHGRIGNKVRKVLQGEETQTTCYRCHELKPIKGAEKAYLGSRLFFDNACGLCHATKEARGAVYGPDLSNAGTFLSLKEIRSAIESPKEALANSIMPKFSLPPEEIVAISYFIKSRVKDPYYETPMVRTARERAQELARKSLPAKKVPGGGELLKESRCLACHKFDESDGQIGPDLTFTAYMRKADYVRNFLRVPGQEIPGAVMPTVPMSRGKEETIIRFLREKRPVHFHGGAAEKNIYMMLCQRCHAAQGDGFGTIQPNLANFPRPFRDNREFFKAIPDTRIVQSIEKGIPGTSMPPYGEMFGRDTVNSVVDLLFRGFIRIDRTDKEIPSPPTRPAILSKPNVIKTMYERQCSRCHGVEGIGKGPDYLKYLPRPRDLTNRPYFATRTDDQIAVAIVHGIPGTGMKSFTGKISPDFIWGLVGKVREFSNKPEAYDNGQ